MDERYVQTKLRSGQTFTTYWLPVDRRVKVGTVITLKGDDRRWQVIKQCEPRLDRRLLRTDWKVGGLF